MKISQQRSTVAIQGGPGSFNDEVAKIELPQLLGYSFEVAHLYTTPNVVSALQRGAADYGQFAIRNSLGGEVEESQEALKRDDLKVVAEYSLRIRHSLMIHRDATAEGITLIMGHPQALVQCRETLNRRYSNVTKLSGEGKMIDPAAVAEAIANNNLPVNTAVLGSVALAEQWELKVIDRNLQDLESNVTTFVLVKLDMT